MAETQLLIGVDPGQTCGWFQLDQTTGEFGHDELDWLSCCDRLWDLVRFGSVSAVVCEKLVVSSRTATAGGSALWVPELVGFARWVCRRYEVELALYSAAQAKPFATREKLLRLGWDHRSSGGHARDAARLAVLWLAKTGRLGEYLPDWQ